MQWSETSIPFDLSWKNLICSSYQKIVQSVLNATVNWVATPDLLKLWGFQDSAKCELCLAPNCTLHHILCNCSVALNTKRYSWRHDSVLLPIQPIFQDLLQKYNSSNQQTKKPELYSNFIKAGTVKKRKLSKQSSKPRYSELNNARDWQLNIDYDSNHLIFPPEILSTDLRPDIVFWSISSKKVILIELTCAC